jgi:cytochrome c553
MRFSPVSKSLTILAMLCAMTVASAQSPTKPSKLGLCAACHGEDGRATLSGYPHLTGQDEAYLLAQLRAYRNGSRQHAQMRAAVGSLSDTHLRDLARWYASLEPCDVRTQQADR